MNPQPKQKTYRNKDYLNYIRSLPCLICGNPESEAHHVRRQYWMASMGRKPHDYVAIPLCRTHHTAANEQRLIVERTIIDLLMGYIDGKILPKMSK